MYILFEEHQYPAQDVQDALCEITTLQDVDKKVSVNYVGYFYNEKLQDCVFILPKVLLEDAKDNVGKIVKDENGKKIEVIANVKPKENVEDSSKTVIIPEDIITPEGQKKYLPEEYRKFIYEFAVWIYRCLALYHNTHTDSQAIYYKRIPQAGCGKRHPANTFLDVVLSLIRFNQENQDYFMFTIKNIHSGMHKINWVRTISKSQAILQDGVPIYLNPVNKKRQINFDEELFIIFFSILYDLNETFGFKVPINYQYELIRGKRFCQYKNGYGKNRLRQIKYKYFSDKSLGLWELCYAFFDYTHELAVNTKQQEYLLAKSFNNIFEAVIDELLGANDVPKGLQTQDDGKRIDHLYTYQNLISANSSDEIYYIGDSKYYKTGHDLGKNSVAKQYTYARNVIQWNIDLFYNEQQATKDMTEEEKKDYDADKSAYTKIKLRDDGQDPLTEGYNILPNFFISASVDENRDYNIENLEKKQDKSGSYTHLSYHFKNRLFDRDTLILSHYNVNFLYIISLYARNKSTQKRSWKESIRRKFRNEILEYINQQYDFWILDPIHDLPSAIDKHFRKINGKVFCPYPNEKKPLPKAEEPLPKQEKPLLYLALEKDESVKDVSEEFMMLRRTKAEDLALITALEEDFDVYKLRELGDDPRTVMKEDREKRQREYKYKLYQNQYGELPIAAESKVKYNDGFYANNVFLIGCYKNEKHRNWIFQKKKYNVRLGDRRGAVKENDEQVVTARYLVLYDFNNPSEYKVYHLDNKQWVYKTEDMLRDGYPNPNPNGKYLLYALKNESLIPSIDIQTILKAKEVQKGSPLEGAPIFVKGETLLKYRK